LLGLFVDAFLAGDVLAFEIVLDAFLGDLFIFDAIFLTIFIDRGWFK
jgi:hypothetical protein